MFLNIIYFFTIFLLDLISFLSQLTHSLLILACIFIDLNKLNFIFRFLHFYLVFNQWILFLLIHNVNHKLFSFLIIILNFNRHYYLLYLNFFTPLALYSFIEDLNFFLLLIISSLLWSHKIFKQTKSTRY